MSSSIRALMLCVLLLSHAPLANAIHPPYSPPTWGYLGDSFGDNEVHASWQSILGTWSIAGGTYNSTAAATTALTTIFDYPDWWFSGPVTTVVFADFRLNARMLNQSGGTSSVGLVYAYQDAANYREVVFSASGTASLRSVVDGLATTVASTAYPGGGQGVSFAVELIVEGNSTSTVKVNGIEILRRVATPMGSGQAGFSTHNALAKFDDFGIDTPVDLQPYQVNFDDGTSPNISSYAGQWSAAGGTFNSGTVQQASVALVATPDQSIYGPLDFVLRARMLNPYGASGNQVGLVFNFMGDTYDQVVFLPTGVAHLDHVSGITADTVATATYGGRRNEWFDVTLFNQFGGASVAVNGKVIFDHVSGFGPTVDGSLGLIAHWAPGKFDDVSFGYSAPLPYSEGFASAGLPSGWSVNGTWTVSAGALQAASVVATSSAKASVAAQTDFVLRAQMLNQYTASGNLVGLMYEGTAGSQAKGDRYEVVFAPTGQAYLDKYVKGVRSRIATATHSIPGNTWFTVELTRSDVYTTVRVNGVTLFNRVLQDHLPSASLGLVTHWSKGRFDNVSLSQLPR